MTESTVRDHVDVVCGLAAVSGRHVVDVGCGDGWLARALAARGAVVVGVECGAAPLVAARVEPRVGGERYVEGRGESLPLPDSCADVVVYLNSLHHVPPDRQADALDEAARVLRPGGSLVAVEPLAEGPFFELTRVVEDESAVRAHAYRVLQAGADHGLDLVDEVHYLRPVRLDGFDALRRLLLAADAGRRAALERHETELRRCFDAAPRHDDGTTELLAPTRANLLVRRAAG